MAFSKQQLQKFADLIKIEISDEKLAEMNIDSVVEWLDKLQKIDTTDVKPMLNPSEHKLPKREDVVTDGNITTSRGLGTSLELGFRIVEVLKSKEEADDLARKVQFIC